MMMSVCKVLWVHLICKKRGMRWTVTLGGMGRHYTFSHFMASEALLSFVWPIVLMKKLSSKDAQQLAQLSLVLWPTPWSPTSQPCSLGWPAVPDSTVHSQDSDWVGYQHQPLAGEKTPTRMTVTVIAIVSWTWVREASGKHLWQRQWSFLPEAGRSSSVIWEWCSQNPR